MVVPESINNIMGGLESTGGVTLHNHKRKLKQRFETIAKLGQGTYGKVQLGINKETGQEVAIKTIKKCKIETEADLIRIRREIQIMSSLRHPYIIHIYEVFENRDKMVLVMEYAAGGELYDYLSKQKVLEESEARRIFRQIAMAVFYCHKHQICHRDLKLENILLDEQGNAKIADFGLSNVFDSGRLLGTFCGSPLYASPEIVKGIPYKGPEVDCWSLGVLLYTLVYGAMPFDGSNFKRLVRQISAGEYFEPKSPSSASELIRGLLTVKGTERLDITAVCAHPWMAEEGKVSCIRLATELAQEEPNRLDLLLALAPPPSEQIPSVPEETPQPQDRPARSMSLGSLATVQNSATFTAIPRVEKEEVPPVKEEKKEKERKRERSSSKSRKTISGDEEKPKKKSVKSKRKSEDKSDESSISSRTDKDVESMSCDTVKEPLPDDKIEEKPKVKEKKKKSNEPSADKPKVETQPEKEPEPEAKPTEPAAPRPVEKRDKPEAQPPRRKSRVFETMELFEKNTPAEKSKSKVAIPGKVSDTKAVLERRQSVNQTKPIEPSSDVSLASTVNLNQLVQNELSEKEKAEILDKPEPPPEPTPVDVKSMKDKENAIKVISHAISESELQEKKASTLPRRKITKASTSVLPDMVASTTKVSQIVYPPIPPPRPSLIKQQSAPSRERIIPIQIEKRDETVKTTEKPEKPSAASSTTSLGRLDSNASFTSSAEPIRKSPREVIIPIAVEGGGIVTPSASAMSKMSDDDVPLRGFGLRSTRRLNSSKDNPNDSASSDEDDDNFEVISTENLFSTLLARMRNLTQRLDEGRPTFPRLFHHPMFDPNRRLTETKSFTDSDPTPWRRRPSSTLPRGFPGRRELPPILHKRRPENGAKEDRPEESSLDRVRRYLDGLSKEAKGRRREITVGTSQTSEFDKYVQFKKDLQGRRLERATSYSGRADDSKSVLRKYLGEENGVKPRRKEESRVDKTIKALRRNSIEVENAFSESKLIKRAVSLEDVTDSKPPPGNQVFAKKAPQQDEDNSFEEETKSFTSADSDTYSSSDFAERLVSTMTSSEMDNVSERIRRKSFYHRFNLPKRNSYQRSSSNMERRRYF